MCGSGYQLSEGECCGVEDGDVDVEDEYWKKMTPTATLCDGVIVMLLFMMKMIVDDSDRHTVSPSLAVRPRLSQDQQR